MFSNSEIQTIHLQSKAIFNKRYVTLDGTVYIGTKQGRLELDKSEISKLNTTGIVSGTYGSSTTVGQFTVNDKGLLTNAENVDISLDSTIITDFNEQAQDA